MTANQNQTTTAQPVSRPEMIANLTYQVITKHLPLYLARGLKKKHMEALYALGYHFYSQAKYKEALPLFQGLTFYHYLDQRGWIGAGGCCEKLKEYDWAVTYYSIASIINPRDPVPALHAFDCYIALKNYPKALICLEEVILRSHKKPEHAALKKRAEGLRDALQKTIEEHKNS